MKIILKVTILLNLLVSNLFSQVGNEWIDFDKTYVKVSVAQDGFYRITPSDISSLGINLSTIDPKTFKLYRRGEEFAITVIGHQDDIFDASDYVEFYGVKNDGREDGNLYVDGVSTNLFYSLYTDTAAYFLTWGGENGKRILNNTSTNQVNNTSFVNRNIHRNFIGNYSSGKEDASFIWLSEGVSGESFTGGITVSGRTRTYNLIVDTNRIDSGSGSFQMQLLGDDLNDRAVDVKLISGSEEINIVSPVFSNYEKIIIDIDLPAGFISENIILEFTPTSLDGEADKIRLSYFSHQYDVKRDFSSLLDDVVISIEGMSKADISISPERGKVYDISNLESISIVLGSGEVQLNNDTDLTKNFFVRKDTAFYFEPQRLELSDFQKVDLSVDYIIITHNTLLDGVSELKLFKESNLGGERIVGLYEIDKLYDTYSYGDRTPYAIRRFLTEFVTLGKPEALFLVGTGVQPGYQESGLGFYRYSQFQADFQTKDLVPTMGHPASDILFSKGLGDSKYEPFIATGRLPAHTNEEVLNYVTKLKDHAKVGLDEVWTKNLLHLSGGTTTAEGTFFLNRITDYKEQAENELMGANVQLFAKRTNLAIEEYNLSEQVNNGLSLITYLGHSSPNTIEIDIGEATDPTNGYNNKGRYPVLFLNGCNSASFDAYTRLENWVVAEDRGAIAGFGHSGFGYTSTLNRYTSTFYSVAFQDSVFYGKSLGEIQKETIRRYSLSSPENPLNYTQMTQWMLLGDPDVRLATPLQPDFTILNNNVEVLPGFGNDQITTSTDSIKLIFSLMNYGTVSGDSMDICIKRLYNLNKNEFNYENFRVKTPSYRDTLELTLFNNIENSNGENTFEISVDCSEEHNEFNELNNITTLVFDMPSNGVNLLYPYDFAIVGDSELDFWIESQNKEQDTASYFLEVATDIDYSNLIYQGEMFSSSLARFDGVSLKAGLDTTVYYWRARIENAVEGEEIIWKTSSFTYISDKTGWGQFEYDQYKQNTLFELTADEKNKMLVFDSVSTFLEFSTVGEDYEESFISNTSIIINDRTALESLWHPNCNVGSYLAMVFDGSSLLSYKPIIATSYVQCGPAPHAVALFRANSNNHIGDMQAYLDSIPVGDYLLLMSTHNNEIESTPKAILDRLESFGSYSLDTLKDGVPYVFIGRKGDSLPLFEQIDTNKAAKIEGSFNLEELTNTGRMSALNIGPAKELIEMTWQFDFEPKEEIVVDFYNVDSTIVYDTLFLKKESFLEGGDSSLKDTIYNFSSSFLDADNRTLSQMDHWALCYSIAPEGTIVLDITNESSNQLREWYQGDTLDVSLAFVNVSPVAFDSLDISWSLRSFENGKIISGFETIEPLKALDTTFFNLALVEPSFFGSTELIVTFNPRTQLEQNYFNNSFFKIYNIEQDKASPVVEAFFDDKVPNGIMGSTINPKIDFYINDNNESAIKKDTNGIEMYISGPCDESFSCDFKPLYFSEDVVTYDFTNTSFHVQLNLQDLDSGYYEIQFFGSDALENKNTEPYILRFYVSAQSALSYFLPYPSPFSSEMKFAYKKTGTEVPENISIQIISATGHSVRLVTQEELGELKSGDNLTSWVWDGTDEKGNLLPNGVYLYKLIIEGNGIKHLETSADKSFNKEWGSIMIAR